MSATLQFPAVPHVMGQGLARVEDLLPSTRGVTLFGQISNGLNNGLAQNTVDGVARMAAAQTGRLMQQSQERQHNLVERFLYLSPQKRAAEAARTAEAARAAGLLAGVVAKGVLHGVKKYMDRRESEGVAERILHAVGYVALSDDGTLGRPNQALLARMLDAFNLSDPARRRLVAKPIPTSLLELRDCGLHGPALEAVAHFAFHARAHVVGPAAATDEVVPLLIRLGMSTSEGAAVSKAAREEYLAERSTLTLHYVALQRIVAGIGLRLDLPRADIEAAAYDVVAFNPYEAARAENRRLLAAALKVGATLGSLATGDLTPALGIAAQAASLLLGATTPVDPTQVHQALIEYRAAQGLPG